MAGTARGTNDAHRAPTVLRRRTAAGLIFLVIALVATLVIVAVRADGREITRASSNDGGAWLVNRGLAVVGHRNHAATELTSILRISESAASDIHQAADIVVVHDPELNQLFEVDTRSFTPDLQPTELPEFTDVRALDGGVLITRTEPLAIWWVKAQELPTLKTLSTREPVFSRDTRGTIAATNDGTIAVIDHGTNSLHWLTTTTAATAPIDLQLTEVIALTIVDGTAVALAQNGDLALVERGAVAGDLLVWSEESQGIAPLTVLQQPSRAQANTNAPTVDAIVGVTAAGDLVEVGLHAGGPRVFTRATMPGGSPLAPIVHNGCIHAVVRAPATYGVLCDDYYDRSLDGAGQELRLRLVNGWVWVNDLDDGGTWVANDDLSIDLLDDWGLAVDSLRDDEDDDGERESTTTLEKTLVDDPDADGTVQDADDFDPSDINVPPVAIDDQARTRTGRTARVDVLANDTDENNDILTISSTAVLAGNGTARITPDRNQLQVTPAPGFLGTIQIEYGLSDGRAEPVRGLLTVDVVADDAPNNDPVAITDVVATAPGHATTIDVLRNDSDPDGDALALINIETDTGTLRWAPTGQITFTPDTTTDAGWIELSYLIADDVGAEAQGTLRVEIRDRGANQEPDARNDHAVTVAGRPVALNLLANDTDPDGDPLIVGSRPLLISPEGASPKTTISPDGEFVFSTDQPGTYLFSYTVTDSAEGGSERDSARVRIDVEPLGDNSPPVAVRDELVIPVGETRVAYVLENDGDPDGDVIGIVDWQSAPGLLIDEFIDATGHVGFRVTATPDAPARPSFTYSISDGKSDPVLTSVVVAIVQEAPRDQPPFATDDVIELRSGFSVSGMPVLANDFDPEGGSLRIVSTGDAEAATITIADDTQTLTIDVDDDAVASFNFPYDIVDEAGNRAAAVVRVQLINPDAPNRPPIARTDIARTDQGVPVAVTALSNDSDPDNDPILLEAVVEQPAHGSAKINSANKTVEYRPDPTFAGTDIIRYAVVDAQGDRSIGDILIGVLKDPGVNLAPVANDDAFSLGGALIAAPLSVLDNDYDPEADPLRVIDVTAASIGTTSLDSFGRVTYTPPASLPEATNVTFTYTIADSVGNQDSATVTVSLEAFIALQPTPTPTPDVAEPTPTPVAEATPTPEAVPTPFATPTPTPTTEPENIDPVAVNDEVGPVKAGSQVVVSVLDNDFDPDGPQAELDVVAVSGSADLRGNDVIITATDDTGQWTYTIEDGDGGEATGTITVIVTANQPPIVTPLERGTSFETAISLDLGSQAVDPDDDTLFFVCCESIRGGAISNVIADADVLSLTFTPNDLFVGVAGFSYVVDDQRGNQQAGTVTIVVDPPDNRPPIALDNTVQVPQGEQTTIDLAQLSSDADGDSLSWALGDVPTGGVGVSLSGAQVLVEVDRATPIGAAGSFSYQVSDGVLSATGTISVTVLAGANEPPVASDTAVEVAAGSGATVDLAALTLDPDAGDPTTFTLDASSAAPVSAVLSGSTVQLNTPVTATGSAVAITWTATDSRGASDTATINITVVEPSAPPPVATDDQATTRPGAAVDVAVLANDVDPLNLGLTVTSATSSQGTTTIIDAAQTVRFSPGTFVGAASVTYTIEDAAQRTASATITIETVGAPETPAPPTVTADNGEVTISWATPQANGSPITGYRITSNSGDAKVVDVQNSLTWRGLTNGQVYTFTVIALSDAGESLASGPSLEVTPDIVPETPAPPVVTFLDGALDVSWQPPANNGSTIVGYELEIGGSTSDTRPIGNETSFQWRGLTNGDEYTFRVRAQNAAGFGLFSGPSPSEHPETIPAAPTIGVTQRANLSGSLIVNWVKPADGGGEIIEYRIETDAGEAFVSGANVATYDWSNLPNGVPAAFRVQARNRAGWGPLSAASAPVAPCGVPDAPGTPTVVRGDGQLDIAIVAPSNNGCGITGYTITSDAGAAQNSSGTSHTFNGLTNGTPYTFTVRATNEMGIGDPSAASTAVTPAGIPICVTPGISVTPSAPQTLALTWDAAIDNGSPILHYVVEIGGSGTQHATTNATFGSLADGTAYTFSVRAVNDVGTSATCSTGTGTTWDLPTPPSATLVFDPDTTTLTATRTGGESAAPPLTSWNWAFLRDDPGGTVTPPSGSGTTNPPASMDFVVTEDGSYSFTYEVCNPVGCRQAAAGPIVVKLTAPPDPPDPPVLTAEYGPWDANFGVEVFAAWSPPANDNGAPVTSYLVESQRIGSSGVYHGVIQPPQEFTELSTALESWPGFTRFTMDRENPIQWEARVAAVNAEGQSEWSEWTLFSPALRDPHVVLVPGGTQACDETLSPTGLCNRLYVEGFGLIPSQDHPVFAEAILGSAGDPAGQLTDFCGGETLTVNGAGIGTAELNCMYGWGGNEVRITISTIESPWVTWPS